MFSRAEQRAITEKYEQLMGLSAQKLADFITQRRVRWIEKHLPEMLIKYKSLSPEEQSYKIIFFEHMGINPRHSKIVRVSPTKIMIESRNFCPYLEACQRLGLDTRLVCKKIGEPSIQAMCEAIHPNLRFSRNYQNIRPHSSFCEEYIELIE